MIDKAMWALSRINNLATKKYIGPRYFHVSCANLLDYIEGILDEAHKKLTSHL